MNSTESSRTPVNMLRGLFLSIALHRVLWHSLLVNSEQSYRERHASDCRDKKLTYTFHDIANTCHHIILDMMEDKHHHMNVDHNMHTNKNHTMDDMPDMMDEMNHMNTNHSMHGMNHSMPEIIRGMMNHTMDHGLHGHNDHINHSLHDGMDHSVHNGHADNILHGNHTMYFTFDFPRVIVVQGWTVTSNTQLIISLLGLCIIAIFLESISRLTKRASSKTLCYMAKKNLKGFQKLLGGPDAKGSEFKKLNTKDNRALQTNKEESEAFGTTGNVQVSSVTSPEVKRTLSKNDGKVEQDGDSSVMSETDIPLTLPQCLQYRLLLTLLHVVQATFGYFLMLAVMTYNWWIFLVILLGSVLGFLIFGRGTHLHALELMASSTLPPNYVSRSTLTKLETSDVLYLRNQESCRDSASQREEVSPLQDAVDNGEDEELEVWKRRSACGLMGNPSSGFKKVDIRIDLQGDSIVESEFVKRLEKSQETII